MNIIISKTKDFQHTVTFQIDDIYKVTSYNHCAIRHHVLFFSMKSDGLDIKEVRTDLKHFMPENSFYLKHRGILFRCNGLFVPDIDLNCFCTVIDESIIKT